MAAKKSAPAARSAKTEDQRRFLRAEEGCRSTLDELLTLEREGGLSSHETAAQYVRMALIYYKRIRNGKVMGPADFNHAVDVATAARRAMSALDPALEFCGHPRQERLAAALRHADGILADYQALKTPIRRG
ncbi:hypothetical protein [Paludibacterium paludis]|uniref:Uncharacterized protein n=1 Tax=Paludibacterium paludis TaxID=1225769 RepID=A0A918UAK3_9NEIS|nr:hypothetical protein [Paludibacterium paludis]GGY19347.1 hypothetical protein GCM10011289_23610 [Paludibacterium paludis]